MGDVKKSETSASICDHIQELVCCYVLRKMVVNIIIASNMFMMFKNNDDHIKYLQPHTEARWLPRAERYIDGYCQLLIQEQ